MAWTKAWVLVFAGCFAGACCEPEPARKDRPIESKDRADIGTGGGVLAVVNGVAITEERFLLHSELFPAQLRGTVQGREHMLKILIDQTLLNAEARRLGADQDPEFIRSVANYRRKLLNNVLLDKVHGSPIDVTEQEARAYYEAHPEEFNQPFETARHNLISRMRAKKRQTAKKVLIEELRNKSDIAVDNLALEALDIP
ncbi:MAG: hypothetical protein ACYSUI_23345 [Planctomycetota bacterium]|jgi:hypothetical protein